MASFSSNALLVARVWVLTCAFRIWADIAIGILPEIVGERGSEGSSKGWTLLIQEKHKKEAVARLHLTTFLFVNFIILYSFLIFGKSNTIYLNQQSYICLFFNIFCNVLFCSCLKNENRFVFAWFLLYRVDYFHWLSLAFPFIFPFFYHPHFYISAFCTESPYFKELSWVLCK